MANFGLSRRETFIQFEGQTFSGTTKSFDKRAGAILGLYLDLDAAGAITFHVSYDNSTWYAITPPLGTTLWATPGTDPIAVPADYLAFLAPYSYVRLTFGASQTAAIMVVSLQG